jgi:pyruvate, water dikinase
MCSNIASIRLLFVNYRFYQFHQIRAEQRSYLGDPAIDLANLAQQDFSVLQGIALPVSAFRNYCEQAGLPAFWPHPLNLQVTAQTFQTQLATCPFDADWVASMQAVLADSLAGSQLIIRQSAVNPAHPAAPHPAIPDRGLSDLWTTRTCAIGSMVAGLQQLWQETFCARNLLYWQRTPYQPRDIPLATIIQRIPPIQSAGRLWVNQDIVAIESRWGLRHESMAWEPPPLLLVADRRTGMIRSQQSSPQSVFYGVAPPLLPIAIVRDRLDVDALGLSAYAMVANGPDSLTIGQTQRLIQLGQQLWDTYQRPLQIDWQMSVEISAGEMFWVQSIEFSNADMPVAAGLAQTASPPADWIAKGITASPGTIVGRAMVVAEPHVLPVDLPLATILVLSHLSADGINSIRQAVGIIAEQGGIASHAAIVARELQIPAIVGVADATQSIRTGDWVQIRQGNVYRAHASTLPIVSPPIVSPPIIVSPLPPLDRLTSTALLVTMSQPEQLPLLKSAIASGSIQGIGLLRAEHLLMDSLDRQHPWAWIDRPDRHRLSEILTAKLQLILESVMPLPVWYRTADWRAHELRGLTGADRFVHEHNPILGNHGAYSYQQFPAWLDLELGALQALPPAQRSQMRLLLPFVRSVAEFEFCRDRIHQAGLIDLPLWIMAEVPSVIFALPEYVAAGVQGITIGMNDLIQLLFAIDRDTPGFSDRFDPNDPIVRRALEQLIRSAQALDIPCHVCSLTDDPVFLAFLLDCGVTGICANVHDLVAASGVIQTS